MKILINAISAKAGGIVTYTTNLLRALEVRGVDFTVAVPHSFPRHDRTLPIGASVFGPARRLIWEQTAWRSTIASLKPDVLFSSANFGLLGSPLPQVLLLREGGLFDPLYLSNIAPVQGVKVSALRYLRRHLMLISARQNDFIMTPSAAMRDMVLAWAPELEDRLLVNPYGTLLETFRPRANPRKWRADGTLRLLFVSVYYPHKNPTDMIQAAEQLRESGIDTHARLTMEMSQIEQVKGSALDCFHIGRAVESQILALGAAQYHDLPALYQSADAFIFPSVSETFGHPMVEALSSGLPVIAADVPINREVLGDAALYYAPFRPSELKARLLELDASHALRQTLIERGRQRAEKLFNWDDHVDRLIDCFERAVASRKAAR